MEKLLQCPLVPAFNIGDIVEIGGEYAGDWRGTLHYVGEITWDRKSDTLKYGTYQTDCKDGMTTDWEEHHLVMHKPRAPQWQTIPDGWHISWFGMDDGKFTCQIKRHDDDLDYISDISFSSSRGYTMLEAYTSALKPILDAYALPAPPEVG